MTRRICGSSSTTKILALVISLTPRRARDRKGEFRSLSRFAFQPNPSVMRAHNLPGNSEPHAGAGYPFAIILTAIESIENPILFPCGNTRTGIFNLNNHLVALRLGTNGDRTARRRV